jgi:hypothetical protein
MTQMYYYEEQVVGERPTPRCQMLAECQARPANHPGAVNKLCSFPKNAGSGDTEFEGETKENSAVLGLGTRLDLVNVSLARALVG